MRFSKKTIALALCIVMCMSMTALGTVAYLTARDTVTNTFTIGNIGITVDETKVSENGDPIVFVDLNKDGDFNDEGEDEGKLNSEYMDEYEGYIQPIRDKANEYKLIPGKVYLKDPTMFVHAGSESAYLRMLVTIHKINEIAEILNTSDYMEIFNSLVLGFNSENWYLHHVHPQGEDEDFATYEFRYQDAEGNEIAYAPEDKDLELPLFTDIQIPTGLTAEFIEENSMKDFAITIEGHAIQSAVFEDNEDQEAAADAAWAAFDVQYSQNSNSGNKKPLEEDPTAKFPAGNL